MATTNVTTTSDVSPELDFYLRQRWLKQPGYALAWGAFCEQWEYPKGYGDQVKGVFYLDLDSTPFTVAQGVAPPGKRKRSTHIYLTVEEIGDVIYDSNVLTWQSAMPQARINSDLLNRQCQNIMDRRAQAVLTGGSTVLLAADDAGTLGALRTDVAGRVSAAFLNKLIRQAKDNRIRPWHTSINPSTGIGTTPIQSGYPVLCDSKIWFDLIQQIGESGGIVYAAKYPQGEKGKIHPAEEGAYRNLRFIVSDWPKIWADGGGAINSAIIESTTNAVADVHAMVLVGRNAYAGLERVSGDQQSGKMTTNAKLIFHGPQSYPPLNQISSSGYLQWDGWKRIDETQIIRAEVAVSL